ncbi:hypothetical protein ACEWY4_000058 [Coilia grayii]|uniref:Transmembrane protein 198 n=1 Tax=Coilia grayii TaxID=363190 RepID=A0ABD1KVK7_9TELE
MAVCVTETAGPLLVTAKHCTLQHTDNMDLDTAITIATATLLGTLYCFWGFRCFRLVSCVSALLLSVCVCYTVCVLLVPWLDALVAWGVCVGVSVLVAVVTGVLRCVALFLSGLQLGLLLSGAALLAAAQYCTLQPLWLPLLAMTGPSVLLAVLSLRWQKPLAVMSSATLGATMLALGLAAGAESRPLLMRMLEWLRLVELGEGVVRTEGAESPICWYSWVVLGAWPLLILLGVIVQWRVTANNLTHTEAASDPYKAPDVRRHHPPPQPSPRYESHAAFRSALAHLKLPKDSLLYKCVHAEVPVTDVPEPPAATHTDHDVFNRCPPCSGFFEAFVDIDSEKLQLLTQEQSASHLWHDARRVRVTASTAKKVPVRTSPQGFLQQQVYPRFHGNAATRHGERGEVLALKWLEDGGYGVTRHGTVLCPAEPWLSASPDGVLSSGELLEIKCPFLKENETVEDLFGSKKYDVKIVEGTPKLQPNGPRGFYMQIQIGLFCTKLKACKLLIWSHAKQVMLHIPYDEAFCVKAVDRLREFYFRDMLPFVSDEHREGRLLFSDRYVQLCKE